MGCSGNFYLIYTSCVCFEEFFIQTSAFSQKIRELTPPALRFRIQSRQGFTVCQSHVHRKCTSENGRLVSIKHRKALSVCVKTKSVRFYLFMQTLRIVLFYFREPHASRERRHLSCIPPFTESLNLACVIFALE